jgi:hypothetical protein
MSFSDFKSTIQSTAVDTIARISEHAEPAIETAIYWGKQGKQTAGTILLATLNGMDKAESFYYNQVPEIKSAIELGIHKAELAWLFTVNLAIVLYNIGSDLVEPWVRLFHDVSDLWQEKAAPTYWSAKDSLSAFYHAHWGYYAKSNEKLAKFELDEPCGVLAISPNTPYNKPEEESRGTIAANIFTPRRLQVPSPIATLAPENSDEVVESATTDEPARELVGLTPEIIRSKTIRALRPIASKLSIPNYGHMNKTQLEQAIIDQLKL